MNIFIKGLNACAMRNQKLIHYREYFSANDHILVDTPQKADIIVLWTCAFRADHRDASIRTIQEYSDTFTCKLIITGCLPDIAPELLKYPTDRVFIVNWKQDVKKFDEIFHPKQSLEASSPIYSAEASCKDAAKYRKQHPNKDITFHDQFIKLLVSEGCNFKCAYCSERLAFPRYRSFLPERLYESCKIPVERTGIYDVILLADSLGQYGCDIGTTFPHLVRKLKTIHPDIRFAFHNLHLCNFLQYLEEMKFFISSKYIKHLNLPIQSASNRILRAMNRIYTKEDIETVFGLFKTLNFTAFDTHIIVGFPGETDEDFEQTMELLLRFKPQYVLASKYMESRSAPSAVLKDKVADEIAFERLRRAEEQFVQAGIICNCDGNELSQDRLKRLHQ